MEDKKTSQAWQSLTTLSKLRIFVKRRIKMSRHTLPLLAQWQPWEQSVGCGSILFHWSQLQQPCKTLPNVINCHEATRHSFITPTTDLKTGGRGDLLQVKDKSVNKANPRETERPTIRLRTYRHQYQRWCQDLPFAPGLLLWWIPLPSCLLDLECDLGTCLAIRQRIALDQTPHNPCSCLWWDHLLVTVTMLIWEIQFQQTCGKKGEMCSIPSGSRNWLPLVTAPRGSSTLACARPIKPLCSNQRQQMDLVSSKHK